MDEKIAELLESIAWYIKHYRSRSDMTQDELAKAIGANQSLISRMERGDYDFTVSALCKLFDVFDADVELYLSDRQPENKEADGRDS